MTCIRTGGGQEVILSGTNLTGCTSLVAMGFGWGGALPVTVNGAGTEMRFTVPNAANFQGWGSFNCGMTLNSFVFQWDGYPALAVNVAVTADAAAAVTRGDALPTLTYSTNPATVADDWTTLPSCSIYNPSDLTTALTSLATAGTFTTRCSGGVKADGGTVTYVDGSITVLGVDVTLSVNALADATIGDALPTVTFTTVPATVAGDWTTQPSCGIFDPNDLTTALTSLETEGTFTTRCAAGAKVDGGTVSYVDGIITVNTAPDPGPDPGPGPGGPESESGAGLGDLSTNASMPNTGQTTAGFVGLGGLILALFAVATVAFRARLQLVESGENAKLRLVLARLNASLRRTLR